MINNTLELQNIVAPFGPQGWAPYITIDLAPAEQGPTFDFVYDLNFDDGSTVRLAQIQFSYQLTDAGGE